MIKISDKPITAKPAETRMGSGKGSPEYWVAVVKPGRILLNWPVCRKTAWKHGLAAHKLPIKTNLSSVLSRCESHES